MNPERRPAVAEIHSDTNQQESASLAHLSNSPRIQRGGSVFVSKVNRPERDPVLFHQKNGESYPVINSISAYTIFASLGSVKVKLNGHEYEDFESDDKSLYPFQTAIPTPYMPPPWFVLIEFILHTICKFLTGKSALAFDTSNGMSIGEPADG